MSEIDLDALEQKARAATAGPWRVGREPEPVRNTWFDAQPPGTYFIESTGTPFALGLAAAASPSEDDAAFIAAANPSTVLALVARLRAAEATIDADLTADNGETWESECMRARVQRDAAESRAQRAEGEAKEWEARAELAARLVMDGPYAKDAARLMDLRLRESDLEERAQRAEERLARAVGALNEIAVWREGPEVTVCFDEPWSAEKARAALAEIADASRGVVGDGG